MCILAAEEVVADSMELILTDGKVLAELSKTDKSLWEKIRDWFFDIIGQIRRSWEGLNQASKTAQVLKETVESLDEIERLFTEGAKEAGERARTAGVKTRADTTGKKFSAETIDNDNVISPDTYSDGSKYPSDVYAESLKDQFDDWMQGIMPYNGYFDFGMTPPVLVRNNAPKIPLIMLEDVVYKFTTDYGHEIAVDDVAKLPTEFKDPVFLFKGSRENSMVVVTDILDKSGDPVIVAIHLNKLQKRARVNRVASLYGKHNIENYVKSRIEAGDLIDASAEKAPAWFTNRGLQLPKLVQTITDAYKHSIAQPDNFVNGKLSISEEISEENSSDNLYSMDETAENPDVSENERLKAENKKLEERVQRMRYRQFRKAVESGEMEAKAHKQELSDGATTVLESIGIGDGRNHTELTRRMSELYARMAGEKKISYGEAFDEAAKISDWLLGIQHDIRYSMDEAMVKKNGTVNENH